MRVCVEAQPVWELPVNEPVVQDDLGKYLMSYWSFAASVAEVEIGIALLFVSAMVE